MNLTERLFEKISREFCEIVFFDYDLKKATQWKVGGVARCIIEPKSNEELVKVIQFMNREMVRFIVVGGTTNLLFSDEGVSIPIVRISRKLSKYVIEGNRITVESGLWVPKLAKILADNHLSGCEHICGIPGSVGGLVYMNGGSQRKGIGDSIKSVKTITNDGEIKRYTKIECCFEYRKSIFQENKEIILEVELELSCNDPKKIKKEMKKILSERRIKFPRKEPNCGSVFVSNPRMYELYGPPGKVIERCGLKGTKKGGAEISNMHANFIVNNNGATASDILYLIKLMRKNTFELTGYDMESEVIFVNSDGAMVKAHTKADEIWNEINS